MMHHLSRDGMATFLGVVFYRRDGLALAVSVPGVDARLVQVGGMTFCRTACRHRRRSEQVAPPLSFRTKLHLQQLI
jgi:hypothetical protein